MHTRASNTSGRSNTVENRGKVSSWQVLDQGQAAERNPQKGLAGFSLAELPFPLCNSHKPWPFHSCSVVVCE